MLQVRRWLAVKWRTKCSSRGLPSEVQSVLFGREAAWRLRYQSCVLTALHVMLVDKGEAAWRSIWQTLKGTRFFVFGERGVYWHVLLAISPEVNLFQETKDSVNYCPRGHLSIRRAVQGIPWWSTAFSPGSPSVLYVRWRYCFMASGVHFF